MNKIVSLLLSCLALSAALYAEGEMRLYITRLKVASNKPDGKSWDSWNGAADPKVVVSVRRHGEWQVVATSEIAKDTTLVHLQWDTGVDLSASDEIKIDVWDKDLTSDDRIGEVQITFDESSWGLSQLHELQFDAVESLSYCVSNAGSLDEALQQVEDSRPLMQLLGNWSGFYVAPKNKVHVAVSGKNGGLEGFVTFYYAGKIGTFFADFTIEEQNTVMIKPTKWVDQPDGFVLDDYWKGQLNGDKFKGAMVYKGEHQGDIEFTRTHRNYLYMKLGTTVLEYVEFNEENTIVGFLVAPHERVGLYPAGDPKTMFLVDATSGKEYNLVRSEGIATAPKFEHTDSFTCYFEKLPEHVSKFHCVEGNEETRKKDSALWSWQDIELRR